MKTRSAGIFAVLCCFLMQSSICLGSRRDYRGCSGALDPLQRSEWFREMAPELDPSPRFFRAIFSEIFPHLKFEDSFQHPTFDSYTVTFGERLNNHIHALVLSVTHSTTQELRGQILGLLLRSPRKAFATLEPLAAIQVKSLISKLLAERPWVLVNSEILLEVVFKETMKVRNGMIQGNLLQALSTSPHHLRRHHEEDMDRLASKILENGRNLVDHLLTFHRQEEAAKYIEGSIQFLESVLPLMNHDQSSALLANYAGDLEGTLARFKDLSVRNRLHQFLSLRIPTGS